MVGGVLGKRSRPPLPLSTGGSRASYSPSGLQLSQLCAKRYTPTSAATVLLGMCQALDRQRVHAHARTHMCAHLFTPSGFWKVFLWLLSVSSWT